MPRVKKCVGAVIYDSRERVFLMKSPKWKAFVVPGGEVEPGESEDDALRREIKEELGIELSNLERVGEKVKPASSDFKDGSVEFHFVDFYAKANSTTITPNHEVSEFGWYSIEDALRLHLIDSTREFLQEFAKLKDDKK